ncbi:MAG TPA: hypothetical protein VL463_20050 [Kofleriaceae bacterium]|jgi:hypothetical protein|nr:hypothetical protein [Kofleriaceae bacterium]
MRGLILTAIAAGACSVGCVATEQPICSEADAIPGFSLTINERPGLPDGVYQWTVTADGNTRTRHVAIDRGKGQCDDCVPGLDDDLWISMTHDSAAISVTDDPRGDRQAGPAHLAIRIGMGDQGATEIARFTFDPVYRPLRDDCQTVLQAQYVVNVIGP